MQEEARKEEDARRAEEQADQQAHVAAEAEARLEEAEEEDGRLSAFRWHSTHPLA